MSIVGNLIVLLTADSAKFEQSMQTARRRTKEMQAAIQDLQRGGLDRLAAGMTFATSQQSRWQQLSAQGASNLESLKRSTENVTRSVVGGIEGFRKFENAITDMGLKVVGLDGKTGKLAEGLLTMGVGGTVTLAITGGLLLIGGAMKKLEEATRKSHDEWEKYLESLRQNTPLALLGGELDYQKAKLMGLKESLEQVNRVSAGMSRADYLSETKEINDAIAKQQALVDGLDKQYRTMVKGLKDASHDDTIQVLPGTRQGMAARAWADARQVVSATRYLMSEVDRLLNRPDRNRLSDPEQRAGATPEEQARMLSATIGARSTAMIGIGGQITKGIDQAAARAAERQKQLAEFTVEVWRSAGRNIQSSLADTFTQLFNGQIRSLRDFARSVVSIVQKALAEILAARIAAGVGGTLVSAFAGAAGVATEPGGATSLPASSSVMAPTSQPINVQLQVYAIDAPGVQQFFQQHRQEVGRQVVDLIRADSMFAAAVRGA